MCISIIATVQLLELIHLYHLPFPSPSYKMKALKCRLSVQYTIVVNTRYAGKLL